MSTDHNNISNEEEEISLKKLLLTVQDFSKEVLKSWKLLLLIIIPFVLFFLYRAFTTPITYPTKLTFMINDDEGGGMGGAMAILSQFGIGGSSGGSTNFDKILELSKTRKIIQQTLFDSLFLNDKNDLIANHLIDTYNYHEKWEKLETDVLVGFKFTHANLDQFTRIENTAFLQLYKLIIGSEQRKGLFGTSVNETTGIMALSAETLSEPLTIEVLNSIFRNLGQFYVDKSIEKQLVTYNVVQQKVDSIKSELDKTEYAIANFKDSHRGLYTYKSQLREQKLIRDVKVLNLMYGESLKNLEIADFTLKSKTPYIQLIDEPLGPLRPIQESKLKAVILGLFIGGTVAILFIIGRKILFNALEEGNPS